MRQSIAVFLCLVSTAMSADETGKSNAKSRTKPKSDAKRIVIEDLVSAAPLPDGYTIAHQEIKNGEKLHGHKLQLSQEGLVSKAIVTIETRKISTRGEKRAAAAAYVNGPTQIFREAGLKLIEKKIPDLEKADLDKRVTFDLVYEKPDDGGKLYVQIQVFFEETGYNVLVVSDNELSHETLTKWALSVQKK